MVWYVIYSGYVTDIANYHLNDTTLLLNVGNALMINFHLVYFTKIFLLFLSIESLIKNFIDVPNPLTLLLKLHMKWIYCGGYIFKFCKHSWYLQWGKIYTVALKCISWPKRKKKKILQFWLLWIFLYLYIFPHHIFFIVTKLCPLFPYL